MADERPPVAGGLARPGVNEAAEPASAADGPRERVHAHLARHPGLTAYEVARATGLSVPVARRRLAAMERDGDAVQRPGVRCEEDRRPAARWEVARLPGGVITPVPPGTGGALVEREGSRAPAPEGLTASPALPGPSPACLGQAGEAGPSPAPVGGGPALQPGGGTRSADSAAARTGPLDRGGAG